MRWGLVGLFAVFVAVATFLTGKYFWDFGYFPYSESASTIAPQVDQLYLVISYITTAFFWIVWGLLLAFCVMYRRRPGVKPHYIQGHKVAEIVWTAVPAAILVGLALSQMPAWAKAKLEYPKPGDKDLVVVQTLAQQYQWNFRYRIKENADDFKNVMIQDLETEKWDTPATEDVYASNLFVPVNRKVLMTQTSIDVIHSFFVPHMRVKQDAVPGMYVPVWFEPVRFRVIDLASQKWEWVNGEEDYDKRYGDKAVGIIGFGWKDIKVSDKFGALLPKVDILYRGQVERGVPAARATHALYPFEIACAELCGAGHYKMRSLLWVGTNKMYQAWLGSNGNNASEKGWKRWVERSTAW